VSGIISGTSAITPWHGKGFIGHPGMEASALTPAAFFDLLSFAHSSLFDNCQYVWEGLGYLRGYLDDHLTGNVATAVGSFRKPLAETVVLWQGGIWRSGYEILGGDVNGGDFLVRLEGEAVRDAPVLYPGSIFWDEQILIGPGSVVEPGALMQGPTIIGANTEVRQGAYVRSCCLIGDRCIVGHATEIKGSVMLNDARAGHFAYIGDSILGHAVNLGAGAKLANLRLKAGSVGIRTGLGLLETGLQKLEAVLGDRVQLGCNVVTNPGTLLGKECVVFPLTSVPAGYHEPNSMVR